MPSNLPKSFSRPFLRIFHILEAVLLVSITLATLYAMVQQFVMNGKIPVRYPIYIAMMAIARYITLGMKELDAVLVVWLSLAAFILAAATLLIRIGHHYWPYVDNSTLEKDE
ncbi:phosphate-starvation-inducible PsiE family protein [Vibrio alginolyticus]|uniref:phosphate-starvation-inducible PsiE family protein n=1 Tax=Vibrio alginolyticus TaxID=663 RepID=UPI003754CC7B